MKGLSNQNNASGNKAPDDPQLSKVAVWIPIGMAFGVAFGLALDNLAVGIGTGIAIGAAIGASLDQSRESIGQPDTTRRMKILILLGLLVLFGVVAFFLFLNSP